MTSFKHRNDGIVKFWCRERIGSTLNDVDVHSQYEYGPRQAWDDRDLTLVAASLKSSSDATSLNDSMIEADDVQVKKRGRRDSEGFEGFVVPVRTLQSSPSFVTSAKSTDDVADRGNVVLEDGKCLEGETFKDIGFLKADATGKITDSAKEEIASRRIRQQGVLHAPIMPLARAGASKRKRLK